MKHSILYLDSRKSRPVRRALSKHGDVSHARDTNQALVFVAECDFDYYFVDADTPQAQAFLRHLGHDPQLTPPSGTVLLTGNDEEDCEAWSVDTFVNRSRVARDIPYIFSHLRQREAGPDNVLTISRHHLTTGPGRSGGMGRLRARDPVADEGGTRTEEALRGGSEEKANGLRGRSATGPAAREPGRLTTSRRRAWYGYAAFAVLAATLSLWLFTSGPFAAGGKGDAARTSGGDVLAGASRGPERPWFDLDLPDVADGAHGAGEPSPSEQPPVSAPGPEDVAAPPAVKQTTSAAESSKEPAPALPPANRPPTVTVSGPALVHVGDAVTYHANASDPDGDSVSYSWGSSSKTTSFQNTGTFTISVTVTDPGGLSASGAISVTVVQ